MSFDDRLTASFRGVTFLLETAGGKGGRRAIPHAYPKKESGWTEDHGAVLTNQSITGRVVGKNYMTQLRDLLTALNTAGPGEFVHPWWGVQQVQVGEVSHELVNEEDQTATVTFQLFEAGTNLFPSSSADTAAKIKSAASDAADSNNSWFSSLWDGDAIDGMGTMIDTCLNDLNEFTNGLPSTPSALREWTNRLANIKDSVGSLLAYPGELARQVTSLLYDIKGIATDPIRALSVYDLVKRRWAGMRAELSATGSLSKNIKVSNGVASSVSSIKSTALNTRLNNNIAAFKQLILTSAAIGKADTIADCEFTYAQQAQDIGNDVADQLNELSKTSIDAGDRSSWRTLRALRYAVVADTKDRSLQLPAMRVVTTKRPIPVALLAWQELGDTEQRGTIIARNRIRNPAFIPAGSDIEVINNG